LSRADPFATFQGEAVYHDDIADYATNEPTMDGTASTVLLFALLARKNRSCAVGRQTYAVRSLLGLPVASSLLMRARPEARCA
jgi:hypothetical protein